MIEKFEVYDIHSLINAIKKFTWYYFPNRTPSIREINLFIKAFQLGHNVAGGEGSFDFGRMNAFNDFVEKKLEIDNEVTVEWWINIEDKVDSRHQLETFYQYWEEFALIDK